MHLTNGGALTPEKTVPRWKVRSAELEIAIAAESARWGDYRRSRAFTTKDWRRPSDHMLKSYFPRRTKIALKHFEQLGWYEPRK